MPVLRSSLIRALFLVLVFSGSGTVWGAEQGAPQKSDAVQTMEDLAEAGIKQALEAISEAGAFYPFALLRTEDEQVQLMGYEGPSEKAPPADQFARNLFQQIQILIQNNPQLEAAAIYRLHMADQEGQQLPGVWCLVDHREGPAMVVFQPLVPKGDGSGDRVLGEMVYQKSEDSLFPEGDTESVPPAE